MVLACAMIGLALHGRADSQPQATSASSSRLVPEVAGGYRLDSPEFARLYGPGVFTMNMLANTVVGVRGGHQSIVSLYSRTGGYMGIGFATPTSMAKQVLDDIVRTGHVTRGWIGVEPGVITAEIAAAFDSQENAGVIVTGVVHGSPAAHAGVQPGDIITKVDAQEIRNPQDLLAAVSALTPGTTAELHITRKSAPITIQVTPQQRPKPATAAGSKASDTQ